MKDEKKEYVLSKQLLRSGTSIGAMIREAEHAETKKDFIHKMAIAQKESNETLYWLELLSETDYLSTEQFESIHKDAKSIMSIVTTIIKNTKKELEEEYITYHLQLITQSFSSLSFGISYSLQSFITDLYAESEIFTHFCVPKFLKK